MAKAKKMFVTMKGTKAMENAIAALGGESYAEEKRVRLSMLGMFYQVRATTTVSDEKVHCPVTPGEYELIKGVEGCELLEK